MFRQTTLGFLYCGEFENTASIAYALARGIPEPFEIHLADLFFPRIRTFLDVGSNTGLYCCRAAQKMMPGARIVAFEPQPQCIDALRVTIELNGWGDRLECHAIGLGDHDDELVLHLSQTGSSFDIHFIDAATVPTIRVPVRTLDHECRRLGLETVDMIKIDVEGYELPVLEGGTQILARDHPVIFVEIADRIRGRGFRNSRYAATLRWLTARGYSVFRCGEDLTLEQVAEPGESDHICMYLCLHGETHGHWITEVRATAKEFRRNNKLAALARPMLNRRPGVLAAVRKILPARTIRLIRKALLPR